MGCMGDVPGAGALTGIVGLLSIRVLLVIIGAGHCPDGARGSNPDDGGVAPGAAMNAADAINLLVSQLVNQLERVMHEIGAFEAKNKLSTLLDRVERGEEVLITRRGKAVARLVPAEPGFDRA
jgi:prevent-host-death family protein